MEEGYILVGYNEEDDICLIKVHDNNNVLLFEMDAIGVYSVHPAIQMVGLVARVKERFHEFGMLIRVNKIPSNIKRTERVAL